MTPLLGLQYLTSILLISICLSTSSELITKTSETNEVSMERALLGKSPHLHRKL